MDLSSRLIYYRREFDDCILNLVPYDMREVYINDLGIKT